MDDSIRLPLSLTEIVLGRGVVGVVGVVEAVIVGDDEWLPCVRTTTTVPVL